MSKKPIVKTKLPSVHGQFDIWAFEAEIAAMPHLALLSKGFDPSQTVNVRIHSECLTGDVFGSKRCDCGQQLENALQYIEKNEGVLIYLRQEGRGIGLTNKLLAYNLQDGGMDTIDANHALGFQADQRIYDAAIEILESLQINKVRLITNNPDKVDALVSKGFQVSEMVYLPTEHFSENKSYLETKANRLGHRFSLGEK